MDWESRINDLYRVEAEFSDGVSSAGLRIVACMLAMTSWMPSARLGMQRILLEIWIPLLPRDYFCRRPYHFALFLARELLPVLYRESRKEFSALSHRRAEPTKSSFLDTLLRVCVRWVSAGTGPVPLRCGLRNGTSAARC